MAKANLIRKRNNVYFTPIAAPAPKKRQWREVTGAIMEHQSQDNAESWLDVFTQIGNECPDRTRRRRER